MKCDRCGEEGFAPDELENNICYGCWNTILEEEIHYNAMREAKDMIMEMNKEREANLE